MFAGFSLKRTNSADAEQFVNFILAQIQVELMQNISITAMWVG